MIPTLEAMKDFQQRTGLYDVVSLEQAYMDDFANDVERMLTQEEADDILSWAITLCS